MAPAKVAPIVTITIITKYIFVYCQNIKIFQKKQKLTI